MAAAFMRFLEEASLFYRRLVMQLQAAYGDVGVKLAVEAAGAAAGGVAAANGAAAMLCSSVSCLQECCLPGAACRNAACRTVMLHTCRPGC